MAAEAGDSRRTVMIAIDGSKQAEEAFDCKSICSVQSAVVK